MFDVCGCSSGVANVSGLLKCYAISAGKYLPDVSKYHNVFMFKVEWFRVA
jgi:hypothetical protein